MDNQKLVLGYWGIRGLAQPIRFLLEYTGLSYEDKRYVNHESWFAGDMAAEPQKNHPLVNLPYLKDGDRYIYESQALYVYIAHKAGKPELLGKDAHAQVRLAQAQGVMKDTAQALWTKVMASPKEEFAAKKGELIHQHLEEFIYKLNRFLEGHKWVAGEDLTTGDFQLYEILDIIRSIHHEALDKYENLVNFTKHFAELPAIHAYMGSERFQAKPFLPPGMTPWVE